jgi:hypothetical protein
MHWTGLPRDDQAARQEADSQGSGGIHHGILAIRFLSARRVATDNISESGTVAIAN